MQVRELHVPDRYAIAITSMARIGGKIYLGLTGGPRVLAVYDIARDKIELEKELFPWVAGRGYCTKVHNAMGILSDGSLLMGEGNHFTWDGIPVTVNYFNRELPESMLVRKRKQGFPDIQYTDFCLKNLEGWDRTRSDPGGVIMKYSPVDGRTEIISRLPQYLYVQSMIVDTQRNRAFGHTIPDNHFFFVDVAKREICDFGHISEYAHHNMVITPDGICYGGWIDKADGSLRLLKFAPAEVRLRYLSTVILKDAGAKVAGNIGIDQWIVTRKGEIYMGTVAESLLFRFDYRAEKFEQIGRLAQGGRVTSMDEDENGIIWIGAGYPNMHLIRFDPSADAKNRLTDFGPVNTTYPRCYFHASCCYGGRLYLGETDGFSPSLHIVVSN
jgi:hypothetical protein